MSLLKKFLSFSIGGYISLLIGLLTTPIITRMISPEEYGIFSMYSLTINILMFVVMLGLDQGFVRFFYEEDTFNAKSALLKKSLKLPMGILIILLPILWTFRIFLVKIIFDNENSRVLIFYIFIGLLFSILNRFSNLAVRMQQKGKLYSFIQVLNQIGNFILILVIYKIYGDNYKVLVLSLIGSTMITAVVSIFFEKKMWFSFENKTKVKYKELLEYSYPIAITVVVSWLFQSADKLFIKYYSNLEELGLYAAAFKIIALLNIIQSGFNTFWIPVSFEKYEKEKENIEFFQKIFKLISFAMLIVGICILLGKDLLILILGKKFEDAVKIFPVLIFMPIMNTVSEVTVVGINFKKKTKYHLIISVMITIVNLIGNYLLVPILGAIGAAISTGTSFFLFFLLRTYFSKKSFDCKYNIKKFVILSILLLFYSIYLSFNLSNFQGYIYGCVLLILTLYFYKEIINEIYIEFIKSKERRKE
ncbi:oligosaccharide flippase family protein [Cetobacterium somerae]|uniref:oligosaccharide flippase family protein n=1 Tax=Cetobacterium sp. NK01 TaxID=2993530 RepID=UPI002115F3FF|nr:oligosaccharide flippase family protein [Cetobacterium sp. NK01]MCQ8212126.1 oligosaccharide flippase family protein [Cetobacterium sp. NK01]